jgi:hypothetical protein
MNVMNRGPAAFSRVLIIKEHVNSKNQPVNSIVCEWPKMSILMYKGRAKITSFSASCNKMPCNIAEKTCTKPLQTVYADFQITL